LPQPAVNPSSWGMPRERWAWVAMALGFDLLWFSSQSLYYGVVSSGWPNADATITYSTAHQSRRFPRVDIRYSYAVDGNEYTGDGFRYSFYMNRQRMRAIEIAAAQAAYPVGTCNCWGIGGRPGRDFRRQNSFQPARCQRIIVSGRTITSAPRQSYSQRNSRDRINSARPYSSLLIQSKLSPQNQNFCGRSAAPSE
jgi:hypothetical protein